MTFHYTLIMIKKILLWSLLAIVTFVLVLFINLKVYLKQSTIVTHGTPIREYSSDKAALLVIDIQEVTTGDMSASESFKKASDDLINRINTITEKSSKYGIPVIFIRNEVTNPLVNLLNSTMAKGSPGAQLDSRLNLVSDHILSKEKEDAFSNSDLDSILIRSEINRLFVVGLDAAHCVNSTIEGARNRGYKVAAISDAIISDPDTVKTSMLKRYAGIGVEILNTEKFFMELDDGI